MLEAGTYVRAQVYHGLDIIMGIVIHNLACAITRIVMRLALRQMGALICKCCVGTVMRVLIRAIHYGQMPQFRDTLSAACPAVQLS